jgi:flagellar protein FlbT
MSGLVLKLAPRERVLVNGAVIENGDRRGRLCIKTPDAHVLRLRDALHPDEVTTPVRRVCYVAQLVLSGDADEDEARPQLLSGIDQLACAFTDAESAEVLQSARRSVLQGRVYQALRILRTLMPTEEALLGIPPRVAAPPAGGAMAAE